MEAARWATSNQVMPWSPCILLRIAGTSILISQYKQLAAALVDLQNDLFWKAWGIVVTCRELLPSTLEVYLPTVLVSCRNVQG